MSLISTHAASLFTCTFMLSLAALTAAAASPAAAESRAGAKLLVYVGGYTKGKTKGIFVYSMNLSTGLLTPESVGPDVENPSFLVLHPNHKYLYAVNEVDSIDGKAGGGVSSYSINPATGALTFLNQRTSGGTGPCHITIDAAGTHVLVANYGGGSAEVLPIQPDGGLGEPSCFVQHTGSSVDASRQEGPHAHSSVLDPAGKFALVCDLGLDKIMVYRYNATAGTIDGNGLMPGVVAPGSGPRHFAFHPDGKHGYCINEMKSTITAFNYDHGALSEYQTISTLPAGYTDPTTCAEIAISPDGKFLYGSNRGHDSLAIYAISHRDQTLSLVGHQPTGGKTPRCFAIDPSGSYIIAANQNSDSLVVFKRNKQTGALTPTGQTVQVPAPVTIVFLNQSK